MKSNPDTTTPLVNIFKRLTWWAGRTEDAVLILALFLMALIPVVELLGRALFRTGITGATEYLQHLTLWIGFLGAMLATREDWS
jgi:TRAP-type C4-dicarboxylate transport system permease small subunit